MDSYVQLGNLFLHSNIGIRAQRFSETMAEGTRDFKRLENMLKESEQKHDRELKEIDQQREKDTARINATLEEIKALINGMTYQYNDIRSQLQNRIKVIMGGQSWVIQCCGRRRTIAWDERPY